MKKEVILYERGANAMVRCITGSAPQHFELLKEGTQKWDKFAYQEILKKKYPEEDIEILSIHTIADMTWEEIEEIKSHMSWSFLALEGTLFLTQRDPIRFQAPLEDSTLERTPDAWLWKRVFNIGRTVRFCLPSTHFPVEGKIEGFFYKPSYQMWVYKIKTPVTKHYVYICEADQNYQIY